eukprot:1024100-Pleurochrysis_carterae.AAC.1
MFRTSVLLNALAWPFGICAQYRLCIFNCTDGEMWATCRAERCGAQLAEDYCSDGNVARLMPDVSSWQQVRSAATDATPSASDDASHEELLAAPQASNACDTSGAHCAASPALAGVVLPTTSREEGVRVSGPQECSALGIATAGSFEERCTVCLDLALAAIRLGETGLAAMDGGQACHQAANETLLSLPSFRTCRLDPDRCLHLLQKLRQTTCMSAWQMLAEGVSASAVILQQRQDCGELLRIRSSELVADA